MKRFTLNLKQMLVAGLCLVGLSANAQFSQTIDRYSNTDYSTVNATWKFSEVATTLGTDTATLRQALDTWLDADWVNDLPVYKNEDTKLFGIDAGDGTVNTGYMVDGEPNCDGRGSYWLNLDGTLGSWAKDAVYNDYPIYDSTTDEFSIPVGNHPETGYDAAATANLKFIFNFNGKQATFAITYTVKPFEVPAPASIFASKQNVQGSQSKSITRTTAQGYDATTVKYDAKSIAEALGIDLNTLNLGLSKMVYAQVKDSLNVRDDSLTCGYTGEGTGFWLQNTVYPQGHEKQGEESGLLAVGSWGNDALIFAHNLTVEDDSLVVYVGQYPGHLKADMNLTTTYYLIYADKAYTIDVNVNVVAPAADLISDYTKVGEANYEVNIESNEQDYQAHKLAIDGNAIITALGVSSYDDMDFKAAKDDDNFYVGDFTANGNGYYFDEAGLVCAWGSSSVSFIYPTTDGEYDIFTCGTYAGIQAKVGNSYTDAIYFVNGTNYYKVNVKFNIVDPQPIDQSSWEIVAKRPVVGYVIPDANYGDSQLDYTFTTDQANELIGTSAPTLYVNIPEQTETEKYAAASRYDCNAYGSGNGAWLGDQGQGNGWAATAYAAICYDASEGKYHVFEMPDAVNDGRVAAGKTWTAPVYLVNEDTHKMIEFDFTIQWVNDSSEMEKVEIVGSENLEGIVASMDESEISIDITKAATALGVTSADILNQDNYYFSGILASGLWASGVTATQGLTFNWDGSVDSSGYGKYSMALSEDGTKINISCDEEIADESTFKSQPVIGFKNGNDVYAYYITLYTAASKADGISNVNADVKNGKIYSINGVQVMKPVKGLYIQNGKKFIVK